MAREIRGVMFDGDMGEAAEGGIIGTSDRTLVTLNVNERPNCKTRRKLSTEISF